MYFVITKNAGFRRKSKLHDMKFTDSHGNVHVKLVDGLSIILEIFNISNCDIKYN